MQRILRWTLSLSVVGAAALVAVAWTVYAGAEQSNVGELAFENELAIPPLLEPREEDGRKVFDLTLERGRTELLPDRSTETRGVNGTHLGPTLRASRGDRVELRVHNELGETTTLHWHGMHLPARADGGPHQPIAPGETWAPSWEIDQPAATLWYHPHLHHETADHVYRGIAGLFIVDDPNSEPTGLPDEYGINDIPVVIQDKRLQEDGSLDFSQGWISPTGRLGDVILINGTYDPHVEISDERVRFRVLNASTARIYNVGFADGREFELVGTDGGLLERSQRLNRVQLSSGERVEIVAAFAPGERVVLRSFEPELHANLFDRRFAGGDDSFDLLEVRATPALAPSPETREPLRARADAGDEDVVRTRSFALSGSSRINGRSMEMSRIDAVVEAGSVERWQVRNASGAPHNFHIHGVSFRVLEYAGGDPPPHLTGLKDTVFVPPGETVVLVVRFPDHADPETPYMFHCHILQHEDRGMMGQFVLVEPGHELGGAAP